MNKFESGVYESAQVGGRGLTSAPARKTRWILGMLAALFVGANGVVMLSAQRGGWAVEKTAGAFQAEGAEAGRALENPFSRRVAVDAEDGVYMSDAAHDFAAPQIAARAAAERAAGGKGAAGGNPIDGMKGLIENLTAGGEGFGGGRGGFGSGFRGAGGGASAALAATDAAGVLSGRAGSLGAARRDVQARRPSGESSRAGRNKFRDGKVQGIGAKDAGSILPSARPQQGGVHLTDGDGCWTAEGAKDGCGSSGGFAGAAGGAGAGQGSLGADVPEIAGVPNEFGDDKNFGPAGDAPIPEFEGENVTPYEDLLERARALARRAKYYKRCRKYALIHHNPIRYIKCDRGYREKKRAARKMAARAAEMKQLEQGAVSVEEVSAIADGRQADVEQIEIPENSVGGDVADMEDEGFAVE